MYSLGKGYKTDSFEIEFDDFIFLKKGSKIEIDGEMREISAIRSIEYANKKVVVKGKLKQVLLMDKEKTHFELMEEVGQINIFDIIEDEKTNLKIGDKVKCNITKESDWEGYNYLYYYAPFVLKELGEVLSIIGDVVNVRYKTTVMMFNAKELDF